MGPFDIPQVAGGGNPGDSSSGLNPLSAFMGNLAASQGNNSAIQPVIQQGMSSLSKIMAQNGGDQGRAMLQYAQSPEGMQLMRTPGALKELTQQFQTAAQEPALQSASVPQGAGGVAMRGQQTMMQQTEYPGAANTQAGGRTTFYGANGPQGAVSNAPEDVQSFMKFAQLAGDTMPTSVMQMAAGYNAAKATPAQQMLFANQLQSAGVPAEMSQAFAYGRFTLTPNPTGAPNYFLQDKWNPASVTTVWPSGMRPPESVTGINPQTGSASGSGSVSQTYFGPGANPHALGYPSQYDPQTGKPLPTQAGSFSQVQLSTAKNYSVPTETVGVNGKINPLAAYGPGGLLALGSGLSAIVQDHASIVSQQLAPGDRTAMGEIVQKAGTMNEALEFLLLNGQNTAAGRSYSAVLQSVKDLGTENEPWSSATYGVKQLKVLRNVAENQIEGNNAQMQDMESGAYGKADPSELAKLAETNKHWQTILNFVPPQPLLDSEEKAIQDGKINVPTIGSAVGSVAKLAEGLGQAGLEGLGLVNNTVPKLNADVDGTISMVQGAKSVKDFQALGKMMQLPGLDPRIQSAITQRFEDQRSSNNKTKGGPLKYSGSGQQQAPSVKQFTQNPTGSVQTKSGKTAVMPPPQGQSNAMYNAQPQGNTPFAGLGTPNRRVGNAFQAIGQ